MNNQATLAAVVWLVLVADGAARDIFVDNVSGDDGAAGNAPEVNVAGGPVRSITRALQLAGRSDRIILARTDQPYRESLSFSGPRLRGDEHLSFTLVGNGAVLDGRIDTRDAPWRHVAGDVYRLLPRRMAYQQLYLDEKPAPRVPVDPAALHPPALRPLQWALFDRHVYFRAEPQKRPEDYPISLAALPVGITLHHVRHVLITDVIVQGFQLDGINAHDGVAFCQLDRVTVRGNGRSGVSVGGSSRITLRECLIGDNGAAQLRTEGHCHAELIDTVLLGNTAPQVDRQGGQVVVKRSDGAP